MELPHKFVGYGLLLGIGCYFVIVMYTLVVSSILPPTGNEVRIRRKWGPHQFTTGRLAVALCCDARLFMCPALPADDTAGYLCTSCSG